MIEQLSKQFFSDISKMFSSLDNAEGAPTPPQVKAMVEAGLRKCNLVSREEFDAQRAVLLRTREKLEALEKKIEALEQGGDTES